jgi:hypothetical protein
LLLPFVAQEQCKKYSIWLFLLLNFIVLITFLILKTLMDKIHNWIITSSLILTIIVSCFIFLKLGGSPNDDKVYILYCISVLIILILSNVLLSYFNWYRELWNTNNDVIKNTNNNDVIKNTNTNNDVIKNTNNNNDVIKI